MAKLKINSGVKLGLELPESRDEGTVTFSSVDPEEFEKMKQNILSIANGLSSLRANSQNDDSKVIADVDAVKYEVSVNDERIGELSQDISVLHEDMIKERNKLKSDIQSLRDSKSKIIQPEVKQITHHKDHNNELAMIDSNVEELQKSKAAHISQLDKLNKKIVEQQTFTIALGIGLIFSLILHIF